MSKAQRHEDRRPTTVRMAAAAMSATLPAFAWTLLAMGAHSQKAAQTCDLQDICLFRSQISLSAFFPSGSWQDSAEPGRLSEGFPVARTLSIHLLPQCCKTDVVSFALLRRELSLRKERLTYPAHT
jgi:hypothetical protein